MAFDPDAMNTKEAAKFLRLSVSTVRRYAADGLIPAWRPPQGNWRFSRNALADLLASTKKEDQVA